MRTLIVDDDPQSHRVLNNLLASSHPVVECLPGAYSVSEGLERISESSPDLVFLDVELPDGLGFDLIRKLDSPAFQVIFITGHDKYAISAIRFGALDYLLKPIARKDLADAIQRARTSPRPLTPDQREILVESYDGARSQRLPSRLVLSTQQDIHFLKVEEVSRLEAQQTYTLFYVKGHGQPLVTSQNIGKYVEQFEPYPTFVQVHRSHLINLSYVVKFMRAERVVVMEDGCELPVSRGFLDDFLRGMQQF